MRSLLALAFAFVFVPSCQPKEGQARVRVLPLDTPVRFVPPPAPGGTTVVVPAVAGRF